MIADEILTYAGFLKNNLQTFFDYFTKGVQVLADTYFDSGNDNSHEIIAIPPEFYSTVYNENRANMFTDRFNSYADGQGMQPFLYACLVKLENGELNFIDYTMISQDYSGWWDNLNASEIEELMTIEAAHDFNLHSFNDYPAEDIVQYFGNDNNFYFKPRNHSSSDAGYTYTGYYGGNYGTHNMASMSIGFVSGDFTRRGDRIDFSFSIPAITGNGFSGLYKQPFILVTDDINAVNYYVTNNAADNNYTETVSTGDGDPFTVYYGDNYVIYYIPAGNKLSYDDIQLTTQRVVNIIVSDNPGMSPIHIPTYDENKFGPEPPEPEPITDDDYVEMGLGVETDGMAMYNMAVVTRDELIQLITDFEANADTGLSFIPHVLGLYKLGISSSKLLTTKTEQIKLHKEPGGKSAFTSVENYSIVENQEIYIDCGSITVDREELLTNTFYDYSPYSTYEMFIPGCGWITLPDTIVGRTLTVSIVFDLTTCSCKGIVRCGTTLMKSGTTIATINGIIGSSVPLSINETGLQNAAIFNGSTQAAMALGTAFLGVGIGNPYMGASGVAMAAGALADNHVAGNTTYTNTKGGATDYSVFGDGWKAVLKITRPVVEIPENYGHTVGFVVNEYGLLGDFHGFTVCVNPHVHISATSDEKEEIKRLLESGVILPDGE